MSEPLQIVSVRPEAEDRLAVGAGISRIYGASVGHWSAAGMKKTACDCGDRPAQGGPIGYRPKLREVGGTEAARFYGDAL